MEGREHDLLWRELERVRRRVHGLASSLKGLLFRVERAEERLDVIEPVVVELAEEGKLAERVAELEGDRETARESRLRVWGVRAGIGAAMVGAVLQILREFKVLP